MGNGLDTGMISIIIVNWNSGNLLGKCVASLLYHAKGCQIVIVDNGSEDSSLEFVEKLNADLLVLRNNRNLGFAAANNLGWRASSGAFILFLNPDTECLPGSIERLCQTLMTDHTVWAVAGQLIGPSGQPQWGFNIRPFPSIAGLAAEMFFLKKIWLGHKSKPFKKAVLESNAIDVEQPAAACLMVKRNALETIGGFDEAFRPAWFEDVDLCRRIRDHGGRIQYQPGARFLHLGGYSLSRLAPENFLVNFHLNQIRYFRKHHGEQYAGYVKRLIVWGLRLRSALSLAYTPLQQQSRLSSAKAFWKAARRIREARGL